MNPSASGIAKRTTALTPNVERMRSKISGMIAVFSGTISWIRMSANSTAARTRNESAAAEVEHRDRLVVAARRALDPCRAGACGVSSVTTSGWAARRRAGSPGCAPGMLPVS